MMYPSLRRRGPQTVLALIATAFIAAGTGLVLTPISATGETRPGTGLRAAPASDSWTKAQTIERRWENADGSSTSFNNPNTGKPYVMTVTADHTTNLRGRERVVVSWKGGIPSAARVPNPYGVKGLNQEYPVVILQCRGTGDQVRPETCFTSSAAQRSRVGADPTAAAWIRDLDAAPEDKQQYVGLPKNTAEACPNAQQPGTYTHLTPYVSVTGTVYPACGNGSTTTDMPPDASADSAYPAAELAAFTDLEGRGQIKFEVRSNVELPSLGCSNKVKCSIVVIPISGVSCQAAAPAGSPTTQALLDKSCRNTGSWAKGSNNYQDLGVSAAVSPALWWTASNWKNRFVIPITFGLPPDTCDLLDSRAPTGFYGSELLAQAALQWAPAYCLRKDRFKFQMNVMSDAAGWQQMSSGFAPAAVVSSRHTNLGTDPIGYAPTAVTGFGIGYVIDQPNNKGEYTQLRLNARLLAKLMTLSYPGSAIGAGHPGMSSNPWTLVSDPEFQSLNPALFKDPDHLLPDQEAGAVLLNLSTASDVINQITDYIVHDAEAMAFIDGKPDPWGMKVNPNYAKVSLPLDVWPLQDDYIPETNDPCLDENPSVYLHQLAAPVSTMNTISQALIDAWPNVQTRCDLEVETGIWKMGRKSPQGYGSRFMLGVVSLGDAARYGISTAGLETTKGRYVEPTLDSLKAGVALMTHDKAIDPWALDQDDVRNGAGKAYPGTMVVYTAAKLSNLTPASDAAKVAQFIRVATTEGQRPGNGNGELPGGYLPIVDSGVTEPLYDTAQAVADLIEAQEEPVVATPEPEPTPTPTSAEQPPPPPSNPVSAPGPEPEPAEATSTESPQPENEPTPAETEMPPTVAASSTVGGRLMPGLLLIAIGAGLASIVLRFAVMPAWRRP